MQGQRKKVKKGQMTAGVVGRQQYGTGGKGVSIAGRDYALWFSGDGIRVAVGRRACVPENSLVTWEQAATFFGAVEIRDRSACIQADIHINAALIKICSPLGTFGSQGWVGRIFSQELQLVFQMQFLRIHFLVLYTILRIISGKEDK